ncbi:metallophosphoesterase family protein [Fervidicoccus fontis]|uniref:Metallophosphoesterase Mre11-like protein n=1 Tax=Fervidicoccus fontis (strain DSM 19380 / JCM 18336 / VKM B-2539 / Kam940) TaxID=1163730 RepID=I0A1C5_FERFK|nr:DNA repair exonuclease [Fervidicoccus fontis]AFH42782.1 metallophosphoesterase Mre11-like protein [Fervidicoccus fontis Kam940]
MVLIAHAADLHFGHTRRAEDIESSLREMIDILKKEHLKFLIIAGDVFDRDRPENIILKRFHEIMKDFYDSGGRVFAVRGDHDTPKASKKGNPLDTISTYIGGSFLNLEINLNGNPAYIIEESGEKIFLYSFPFVPKAVRRREDYLNIFKKIEKNAKENGGKSILIGHFPISELFPFEEGYSLSELPDYINYYALGHLHFRIIEKVKRGILAYPSSIEILNVNEINDWKKNGKGFYIVDFSEDVPNVQKVNLNIRPMELFRGEDVKLLIEEVKRYLSGNFSKSPYIKIELKVDRGKKREARIAIRSSINKEKVYELEIEIREKEAKDLFLNNERVRKESESVDIITSRLGDKNLALLLLELKECAIESKDFEKECNEILNSLFQNPTIKKISGSPCIEGVSQFLTKQEGENKNGLLSYVR